MQRIYLKNVVEVRKEKKMLEEKLNLQIKLLGRTAIIEGDSLDEYEAELVFEAMNFGFSAKTAVMLKDGEMQFKLVRIKEVTRRKNLDIVKARIIGTHGKTRRALENITNTEIMIRGNEIGVIGPAAEMDDTVTGIQSLVRGSKQSNVYKFLEKMNKKKKEQR